MKMSFFDVMESLKAMKVIYKTVTIPESECKGKRGLTKLKKFESLSNEQKIEYIHSASVLCANMNDILRNIKDSEFEI